MTCYNPINSWLPEKGTNLNRSVRFDNINKPSHLPILYLPCGKCIGCRIDRTQEWATRLTHEAIMHTRNAFITLTYDDQHLPHNMSLSVKTLQNFIKALRQKILPQKIRFYACGEYGTKLHRPHYHALIFGYDFPDKTYFKTERDNDYYVSLELSKIWGNGYCIIGEVTHQSAAYCARYVTKKINGDPWHNHYQHLDTVTGELMPIKEEFAIMSRKPGLGNSFYQKYKKDIFPDDEIIIDGQHKRIPPYYMALLKEDDHDLYEEMKIRRLRNMEAQQSDNTQERLKSKERCHEARIGQLIRTLE